MTNKDNGGPASDRELLEMAAKAAGIVGEYHDIGEAMRVETNPGHDWWNPLTDDGDALRLAVNLGVMFKPEFAHFLSLERLASQGHDDYAATRRAIVRAAAAIGEVIK